MDVSHIDKNISNTMWKEVQYKLREWLEECPLKRQNIRNNQLHIILVADIISHKNRFRNEKELLKNCSTATAVFLPFASRRRSYEQNMILKYLLIEEYPLTSEIKEIVNWSIYLFWIRFEWMDLMMELKQPRKKLRQVSSLPIV